MWHKQDLKDVYEDGTFIRTFQYNNKTEVGLQGASDWIFNGSLNFSTENSDRAFRGSIVANYQSDKIYALGAPEVQTQTDVFYNDEIVEKGFVTLDAIISKNFGIERYQAVRPSTTGIEADQTVRSYSRGAVLSLGVGYSF